MHLHACPMSVLLYLHHNSHLILPVPPCPAEEQPSPCFCEDRTPPLCWVPDPQRGLCQHAGPSECKRNPDDEGFTRIQQDGCVQEGDTPLHDAVRQSRLRIIQLLLLHGADTHVTNQVLQGRRVQERFLQSKSSLCNFLSGGSSPPRWCSGVAEWNEDTAGWAGWQEVMSQQFLITVWLTSGQLFNPAIVSSLISHLLLNKSSTWWKQFFN